MVNNRKLWICPVCHHKHWDFIEDRCRHRSCPTHKETITDDPKKSIPANHPPQSQKELF